VTGSFVAPLTGWNVRGYSYGERTSDGQLHPGADLNVGYGDDDRGLPVLAFAAGTVAFRGEWDGTTYGYGNFGLVEHVIGGGVQLWSLYAHLDSFDDGVAVGAPVAAGQRIGACGKSGGQEWAHLHFELRYGGPPEMPPWYWGGRLTPQQLSERYADPYTLMKLLGALPEPSGGDVDPAAYAALQADRDFNFRLKQAFEHELRTLEQRRRLKHGTVARLIAGAA
jgi:murein DD-endopeptidase MepM/ murein hydrolase activator NlpD